MGDSEFALRDFSTYSVCCINYASPSVKEVTLRVCNVALSMLGTNEKVSVSAYIVCQVANNASILSIKNEENSTGAEIFGRQTALS